MNHPEKILQFRQDIKKLARHLAIEQGHYPQKGAELQVEMDAPKVEEKNKDEA